MGLVTDFFSYAIGTAYWVFGRRKFTGYVLASKASSDVTAKIPEKLKQTLTPYITNHSETHPEVRAAELLARVALMKGNSCDLLIDGQATFKSIFSGVDGAEDYVLVQFYIVHDDSLGQVLQSRP